jgi:predicted nucleic acid-binding protein
MKKILIDTDVLLDLFFDRKPFCEDAAKVLGLCETKKIQGFITPVILSNLYYVLRKSAPHKAVVEQLLKLFLIIEILPIGREAIQKALMSSFNDFEDALQHFAAVELTQIEAIITRNIKDFRNSQLPVLAPDQFLAGLDL